MQEIKFFESLIKDCENKLPDCTFEYQKLLLYHQIITYKITLNNYYSQPTNLYFETKKLITTYLNAIEEKSSHYYTIDYNKINELTQHLQLEDKISILKYTARELKINGFEKESAGVFKLINKYNLKLLTAEKKNFSFIKFILAFTSYNVLTIFFSLIMIFLLYSVILLPSNTSFYIFEISYENYTENFFVNHFLNTLLSFSQIDSDFKIKAVNWIGVLALEILNVVVAIIIINYLFNELKKKL